MRHEKGISHDLPRLAADRAAQLIAEITGAQVGRGIVDNDPEPKAPRHIQVSVERMRRLLGIELEPGQVGELLRPLGFTVSGKGEELTVDVPSHRLDVELPADVAEEVARAYGYDRVEGRLPYAALPPYRPDPSEPRHRVRRILAGIGLDEVVTYALVGSEDLRRTGLDPAAGHLVRVSNPLSEEHSILRPTITPSLLAALAENARRRRNDAWLFEVGKAYWFHPGRPTPRERKVETAGTGRYEGWELGIALAGSGVPVSPGEPARPADVATLKGIVDALHDALAVPRPIYAAEDAASRHPHRHPGRAGLILGEDARPYGAIGEVHPHVAEAWGLTGRVVDATIDLDRLLELIPERRTAITPPALQPIDRDLAVVVDEATPLGEVLRVARRTAGPLLVDLHLFDVYRGDQVGTGRVSYALAMRFAPVQPGDDKLIDKALNRIRGALGHHLGAEIR